MPGIIALLWQKLLLLRITYLENCSRFDISVLKPVFFLCFPAFVNNQYICMLSIHTCVYQEADMCTDIPSAGYFD